MSSRGAKIYVGHLHPRTSERDLYDIFERYGRIYRIDLKHCYAFIDYNNRRDAEDAVYAMNGREIDGERIVVEWTRGTTRGRGRGYRPERSDYRVRVDNLPDHAHWQDLKDYFRRAGDVIYGDINGTTGVIEFRYPEDVSRAIKEFDRTRWNGSTIYVEEDSLRRHRSENRRKRSRSPSHSRSRSRNHRRIRSGSRSPKTKRRSKSPSKSRSKSPSKHKSPSQSRSKLKSKSKSRSKSRSKSKSRTPRHSRSRSTSRNRRDSRSHSTSRKSASPNRKRSASPDRRDTRFVEVKKEQNGEKTNQQEIDSGEGLNQG